MKIETIDNIKLKKIVSVLKDGGLVILPTETVYGAMVDATNQSAVDKLNTYKNRPKGKPHSIAVVDMAMAEKYVELNKTAKNLYETFLPGPVTVISKGKGNVAKGVASETGTVGVRIPDYPLVLNTVKALGNPITATSANASYKKRPYKISDILDNISDKQKKLIDLIVDAGELPRNEPSTVIDTTLDDTIVLRQGDIKLKNETEVLSRNEESTQNIGKELWQKYEKFHGKRALIFALEGPMGVGKTQFTKGLARALGIQEEVISPSYNLEEEYEKGRLYHIDAWRMESEGELQQLDFAKKLTDKSVVVIEWADRVAEIIRSHKEDAVIVWVKIRYREKDNERFVSWGVL